MWALELKGSTLLALLASRTSVNLPGLSKPSIAPLCYYISQSQHYWHRNGCCNRDAAKKLLQSQSWRAPPTTGCALKAWQHHECYNQVGAAATLKSGYVDAHRANFQYLIHL